MWNNDGITVEKFLPCEACAMLGCPKVEFRVPVGTLWIACVLTDLPVPHECFSSGCFGAAMLPLVFPFFCMLLMSRGNVEFSCRDFFISLLLFRCILKYYESILGPCAKNSVVWLKFRLNNSQIWLNNSKFRLSDQSFDMGQLFAVKRLVNWLPDATLCIWCIVPLWYIAI